MKDLQAAFREYMRLERQRSNSELSVSELQRWTELKRMLNREMHPDQEDDCADRRESIRAPVNLKLSFESYGEVGKAYMTNFSRGGLFVSTSTPLEIGTHVELRIQVKNSKTELKLPGEVVSINVGGSWSHGPGMGVRFGELAPEQQKGVDELYEHCMESAFPPRS
jgi:type IV pilus assembly protein PilZ